ncbi:J domain-containing protein [Oceanicella sp. SM1341]|uniref:J domain-containing protein n=1 Tax=Oceanicella sp. SM1341 TaxID=1548889 RepID=UPI000E48812F|nr:J domain-containing protein [Oceanicella sp. SM1341]
MTRRSPLDYDISVSADKARRTRQRGMSGAFESSSRGCDHPGCEARGTYRAPRSPEQLNDYYWFCIDHVREYNRRWNFFQDLSGDELEQQIEADRLWGRPTWSFGRAAGRKPVNQHTDGQAWRRFGFSDPMDVLGDNATINPGARAERAPEAPRRRMLPKTELRALEILDARDDMAKREIRRLYKDLVKNLHPDMNGGSREDEERLQEVFWAWEQIRASRSFPD